ncbi:mechanosensitive ion channel [Sphingobacterium sp. SRCM116780]|uniref:mechanosensitive ion channel domain-containing protein n=1 Tax=Sphingobacterium sp. SRCM116780 TaxID=2907623 RepID=UPI001F41C745|nr:mechanosensitive ion channel domain-containing protein [Sphingobacterium sp. SRCM116780]UIR56817.1 mechanosensitive ion channel [Sphingobacterium sp. SRCM116780]
MKYFKYLLVLLLQLSFLQDILPQTKPDSLQVKQNVSTGKGNRNQPGTTYSDNKSPSQLVDTSRTQSYRRDNKSRRETGDTTRTQSSPRRDSIRADLKKINTKYIENIRAAALENEAIRKRNIQTQFVEKVNSFSAATPTDSIAPWTAYARSQISDLNSFQSSLASYNRSLNNTLTQLKDFRTKYAISTSSTRLNTYLTTAEQQVQSKIDSLKNSVSITNDNLKAYYGLSKNVKETAAKLPTVERVVSDSTKAKSSLWKAQNTAVTKEKIISNLKNNFQKSKSIDTYVNKTAWTSRILLVILVFAYLYWIISTAYILNKHNNSTSDTTTRLNFWTPIGKAFILLLTLLPLVSIVTPTVVIQGIQLLIMCLFVIILRKKFTVNQGKIIGLLLLFYIFDVFVNSVASEDLIFRILCIIFNLIALFIVFYLKRTIKDPSAAGYTQLPVFIIFTLLNVAAIFLNILGYVDHSRSFSIAAAVGLMQSFTLTFFVRMIKNDVKNQFTRNRIRKGFWLRFNEIRALKSTGDVLKFLCFLLSTIVLANNLQFAAILAAAVSKFLSTAHHFGGASFTFGNLVLAVIILTAANWFQKNLNLLLIGGENGTISKDYDQKMTLFPLFRLIIIVIGFFIAVSALGLSLDKLTVIIGALSVGIGLGMQNIINNFVSGIILVFDKPFRVGDQIELMDKKGRVKEIGIRASVLNTGDGADVIIPNGDLLSGRVVNWTLSSNYARTSFVVQVDRSADLDVSKSWIREAIEKSTYSVAELGATISVQDISEEMIYLNIGCWITNSTNSGGFKSDVLIALDIRFKREGLKFFSIIPPK